MKYNEEVQRWPWQSRSAHTHGRAPFTMWVPQDAEGQDDDTNRRGHGRRRGESERGGRGEGRGGPFPRGGRGGGFGPGGFGGGGFGPGGNLGRGRGRGGRGRRGDVRAAVLLLLDESPMHGYELIQQIVARSEGAWKPSPGSIYPALSQLEDEGLLLIDKVAGRKTARLTEEGVSYVAKNRAELGTPWDDVRTSVGVDALDLRELIGSLMGAAGQVATVGTPDQVKAAADVLTDARRRLYRILAEDENGNDNASDVGESRDDQSDTDA